MPFSIARVEELLTLHNHVLSYNLNISDIIEFKKWLDEEKQIEDKLSRIAINESLKETREEERKEKEKWEAVAPLCPECGAILLPPIKLSGIKRDNNRYGWSCLWQCVGNGDNEDCIWERYSYENAIEIIEGLFEGDIDGYNFSG